MAKNSIRDYDATSANNTDVQSVDISEGCAASGINNAIREVMADLKNVSTGAINLETPGADQLNVDNIRIDGNTISSTDTNGNVTITPNGTGSVQLGGDLDTNGNNISFGDGDIAQFGDANEFTIKHQSDGATHLKETGSGSLFIDATNLYLRNEAGESYFRGISDGSATLYHNNNQKLITTSSGVTITGDITADNLAVANTPVVTARKGANQTLSRATFTKITGFTTAEYDSDSAWDGSRFTVPSGKGGRYLISCHLSIYFGSAGGDGEAAMGVIYINGSAKAYFWRLEMNNGGRHFQEVNGTGSLIYDLSAGDYVEFYAYMRDDSASGSLIVIGDANHGCQIGIMRID